MVRRFLVDLFCSASRWGVAVKESAGAWSAELFEQLVAEGITAGEFAAVQPATAALTLMGVLEVAARPHLWPPDRGDEAERTRRMFEIVLTGLAIPPPKH